MTGSHKIAVIGMGYVGLPAALAFASKYDVIGYDISEDRIQELNKGYDKNKEHDSKQLGSSNIIYTSSKHLLQSCDIFIVTVPTPIDNYNQPNLTFLNDAATLIGGVLKQGDYVVFESTVFPGCTEEVCIPILECSSGLKLGIDFKCGYSPERINPSDKVNTFESTDKIVAGSDEETTHFLQKIYQSVIQAKVHIVGSIKVAEAAKIIENTQRDLNIALVNEFSSIFRAMDIDTTEVLAAAGTKWNFLNFTPGLVGGHCIGVDPYYLTYKANALGVDTKLILAGRSINEWVPKRISEEIIEKIKRKIDINFIKRFRILIIGCAFKENCSDVRNSKVFDLEQDLRSRSCIVEIFDPCVEEIDVLENYDIELISEPKNHYYDGIILAVPHLQIVQKGLGYIKQMGKKDFVFYDVKSVFKKEEADLRL